MIYYIKSGGEEMANIEVYISNDTFLLEQKANEIIKSKAIDEFNINKYNFLDCDPLEIINEARTISLLGDEKMVIVSNPEFLKATYSNEKVINEFISYFEASNPDCLLIILVDFTLDYHLPINTSLKANANINVLEELTGEKLLAWMKEKVNKEGYQININAANEIIERCDGDILCIHNELDKLMMYHAADKNIAYESVLLLVSRNLDDNIYNLLNAFVSNDKRKVLSIYNDFMAMNEDEMRILNAFQGKIEEILYTKILMGQGLKKDEIAAYFRVKSGRAYYMMENAKTISTYDLKNLIQRITDLDFQIKSGAIDKKLGLQLFILGA